MFDKVAELKKEIEAAKASTQEELEAFRMRFISRKSVLGDLFAEMKNIEPEKRKEFGQSVNEVKNAAQEKFKALIAEQESSKEAGNKKAPIDLTLPPLDTLGTIHPLTLIHDRIVEIFQKIGFNVEEGPEIEDDWHNFSALNFPENHPAREMQDTFFVAGNKDIALRTHTSSVQIRAMENKKPPFRSLAPGRVYRNEAISARAHCFFHQVEGFYVDKNVSLADLKQTLYHFAKELFGEDTKVRFRPSYFPFTEPSAEMDISCNICKGEGCNICKYTGWVEILGSGMIDPNVLENCGIDSNEYTGFAFGMGIERIAMLKYQVNDLRLYSENDVRFLNQFKHLS